MARRSPTMVAQVLTSSAPVTCPQLQAALGNASRATTFRYLRQVPYVRSYNHNGRYYAHRDRVRFDRRGLFSLGDIRFSRDGSLSATVRRFVREADAGHTHKELQDLLRVSVQYLLQAGVRRREFQRERIGKVWVYFSGDPATGRAQRQARQRQIQRRRAAEAAALEPALVIAVLLDLVRHPGASPAQVARRLRRQLPPVRLAQVSAVFTRYGLAQAGR